ncbi:MAG: tripartite tricarboxylate transporter substrate binding protein [Pseudomonadota bacterium]
MATKTPSQDYPNGRNTLRALAAAALCAAGLATGGGSTAWAAGEAYPTKPIRLIVGYAPGGGADIMGRLVAQHMAVALGQPVVVENKPGAGQNIGTSYVAKAPPDGYTLLLSSSALAVNASLYNNLDYDAVKSFAPAAVFAQSPNLMVVPRALGVETVQQFIAYAKAHPDSTNFSSSGNGSTQHLAGELLKQQTGIQAKHIAYRGSAPSITAIMSNETQVTFINIPSVQSLLSGDKLRALAITSNKRSPLLPNVPTMAEAGVKNMNIAAWYGVLAPAGTPRPIIDRLNAAINASVRDPAFRKQIEGSGAETIEETPAYFSKFLAEDIARWRPIIRAAEIKPE